MIRIDKSRSSLLIFVLVLVSLSCSRNQPPTVFTEPQGNIVPAFSADSAFSFIEAQINFGPRVPNTPEHTAAAAWKIAKLLSYAGESMVYPQRFTTAGYNGDTLQLTNIIAAFNPTATDRIMLCAHWDSRPRSDADMNPELANQPVLGADDGASGVAVLIELARLFRDNPPPIGVDLVLFDGEDYGEDGDLAMYFLGSRHWAQNQLSPSYKPRFGILLDMVGGKGALFPKEVNSMNIAPSLVDEIWQIAGSMGYEALFPNEVGLPIQDDHVILNQYLSFPTIDIIHHRRPIGNQTGFPDYWHTSRDNIDAIDKRTLEAVGNILTEIIYNRL